MRTLLLAIMVGIILVLLPWLTADDLDRDYVADWQQSQDAMERAVVAQRHMQRQRDEYERLQVVVDLQASALQRLHTKNQKAQKEYASSRQEREALEHEIAQLQQRAQDRAQAEAQVQEMIAAMVIQYPDLEMHISGDLAHQVEQLRAALARSGESMAEFPLDGVAQPMRLMRVGAMQWWLTLDGQQGGVLSAKEGAIPWRLEQVVGIESDLRMLSRMIQGRARPQPLLLPISTQNSGSDLGREPTGSYP